MTEQRLVNDIPCEHILLSLWIRKPYEIIYKLDFVRLDHKLNTQNHATIPFGHNYPQTVMIKYELKKNTDVLLFDHLSNAGIILLWQHGHPPQLFLLQPLQHLLLFGLRCLRQLMTAICFILLLLGLGCVLKLTLYLLLLQLFSNTHTTDAIITIF